MARLLIINPYNNTHMKMLREYEIENNNSQNTSDQLNDICNTMSEKEYFNQKRKRNEIEERLFIEQNSKIVDSCHIQGEKDIRTGRIILPLKKTKGRKIIPLAVEYALNSLHLEEVFIMLDPNDKDTINYLTGNNYEYLGEEHGKILFLKEQV